MRRTIWKEEGNKLSVYTVDQRLKTYVFLLNRVNCSLSFLLFICVSKGNTLTEIILYIRLYSKLHLFRMLFHVV